MYQFLKRPSSPANLCLQLAVNVIFKRQKGPHIMMLLYMRHEARKALCGEIVFRPRYPEN